MTLHIGHMIEVPVGVLDLESPVHEGEGLLPAYFESAFGICLLLVTELDHQTALVLLTTLSLQVLITVKLLASEVKLRAWQDAGKIQV